MGRWVLAMAIALTACEAAKNQPRQAAAPESTAATERPPGRRREPDPPPPPRRQELDVQAQMGELPSLAVALEDAKPKMTDTFNDTSEGTNMFVFWAHKNMTWADVGVPKNETSFGKVKKDSEAERGRRMCAGVSIVQIEKVIDRIYSGLASTDSWEIIRLYAVGSTGELVERSRSRFAEW